MPRPVQILLVLMVAALLAFAAAATAPFHSPSLTQKFMCPDRTTLQIREYHASWNAPGETGISIGCVDAHGVMLPSSPKETQGFWILFGIYFIVLLAIILILAWLVLAFRRNRSA
jgi:hypothetical protein